MVFDHAPGRPWPEPHRGEVPAFLLDHTVGGEVVVVLVKLQPVAVDPKRPAMAADELLSPVGEHGAIEVGSRCEVCAIEGNKQSGSPFNFWIAIARQA